GFSKMKALSTNNDNPEKASRPFDVNRDGFVMAEGGGVLFLEAEEHAKARGATNLGEIVGYGATTDAYHMNAPDYREAMKAMRLASLSRKLHTTVIDYILAYVTRTASVDNSEKKAIQSLFEDHINHLKVSSTKSMTGHMFGAAGGE